MRPARSALCFLAVALLACSGPLTPVDSDPGSAEQQPLATGKVGVLDGALTSKVLGCSGLCVFQWGFWVDLTVANEAFHKEVAVVWTQDGWRNPYTALAKFERRLPNGREQWGVDVPLGQGTSPAPEIEYAVYVRMNGATSWDPLNNHFLRDPVSPARPVRLLRSGLSYEVSRGVVVSGDVRVLNVAFEKRVTVRYTTDGWASAQDAEARWVSGQDWRFEVALGTPQPLPDSVDFAVRFRSGGVDAWDNHGGDNYRLDVRPVFTAAFDASAPFAGILSLSGSFRTDLPREGQSARLDGQPFQTLDALTFTTLGLADGAHTAEFRFEAKGGYQELAARPFTVRNRITPLSSWTLPQLAPASEFPWDAVVAADGKVYALWSDGTVARSPSTGSAAAPFVYPALPSAARIAVDGLGRLYVLASNGAPTLTRLLPSGARDAAFGQGGTVSLSGSYDGSSVCYAGYVSVAGPRVIVSDTCNERLLVLDETGAFRQALQYLPDYSAISHQVFFDGTRLWAPSWSRVLKFLWNGSDFVPDGALALQGLTLPSTEGVVLSQGLLWLVEGSDRLLAVNATTGALEARWQCGGEKLGLLGEAALPRSLALLPDGTLGVLGATSKTFERFAATLK